MIGAMEYFDPYFTVAFFRGSSVVTFLTLTCTIYYRLLEATIGSYLLAFEGI